MMVTPLEAIELLSYLEVRGFRTQELKEKCQDTINKFRLDHPGGNGRRAFIRRTYTCPFFNHQELGCPLPRDIKPYGCLAFNAHHAELKAGEHCYSEKELLIKREKDHPEEIQMNEELRRELEIFWEKTPLPLALVELWERGSTFFSR